MLYIIAALLGYLIGSIPFGLLLTRAAGMGDIRKIGSGNIGATNVLRTGHKKLALATLLLDMAKGAAAGAFFMILYPALPYCAAINCLGDCPCLRTLDEVHIRETIPLIAALFAILGHLFPIWLKFRGGKGVATTFGALLALSPLAGALTCGIWLIGAFTLRYSSLAALIAVALCPTVAYLVTHSVPLTLFCTAATLLVVFKHRDNVTRLLAGTEPKIGEKKSLDAPPPSA